MILLVAFDSVAAEASFRQAEIQNLGLALTGHEDVCWLYIAMDDALLMRCIQSIHNLNSEIEDLSSDCVPDSATWRLNQILTLRICCSQSNSRSVCPSNNCITRNVRPSCSPNS